MGPTPCLKQLRLTSRTQRGPTVLLGVTLRHIKIPWDHFLSWWSAQRPDNHWQVNSNLASLTRLESPRNTPEFTPILVLELVLRRSSSDCISFDNSSCRHDEDVVVAQPCAHEHSHGHSWCEIMTSSVSWGSWPEQDMLPKTYQRYPPASSEGPFIRCLSVRSNPEPGEEVGCMAWQPHHTWVTWFHLEPKPFLKVRQHRPDLSLHFSYCDLNEAVRLVILHRRLSKMNL